MYVTCSKGASLDEVHLDHTQRVHDGAGFPLMRTKHRSLSHAGAGETISRRLAWLSPLASSLGLKVGDDSCCKAKDGEVK